MPAADQESPPAPNVARRLVREVAVQLLHSSLLADSQSTAGDPWPLILAHHEGKIIRSRARAVLHLQQNRAGRAKPFLTTRGTVLPLLENFLEGRSPSKAFRQLFAAEEALPPLFDLLKRQLKSEKEQEAVFSTLQRISDQNVISRDSLQELGDALGKPGDNPQPLVVITKAVNPLKQSADLLQQLLSPTPPELRELSNLHNAIAERDQLRKEGKSLHALIVSNLPETDRLIAAQLENFAPDRLGKVDRAVLRLAVTEFHHCPEIPVAVTINEAIEVARRFGDIESAGFANGILDKLKPADSKDSPKKP